MNDTLRWIALLTLTGCGSAVGTADGGEQADAEVSDAGASDGGGIDAGDATGPQVYVHLIASQDPVPHATGSSGQTPRDWVSGIRSLHLLRSMDDPDPVLVFSHGDGYVEASYADGADTIVGSAPIADLEPGVFTWARAVHTHVRFTIDATLHAGFGPTPGILDDLIVLSDRTTVDGVERAQGDYLYTFTVAGMSYPASGTGYTLPAIPGGGFQARVEAGETAYYFPAPLVVDDTLDADVDLLFEVNVHEGFRWMDQPMPEYADGVFDTTTVTTEPIVQAGANSYGYRVR